MEEILGPVIRLLVVPGALHKPKVAKLDFETLSIRDFLLRIGTVEGIAYGLFGPSDESELPSAPRG